MLTVDTSESLLMAARAWAPTLEARADEGERLRTMPADLAEAAKRAGLFTMVLPRALGGAELDPVTVIEVVEELSRADGSAGWTVMIGNATAFFAWLEPSVASEMLAGAPHLASTAVFAPKGKAVPDGRGGLTVSGRWGFNSGCPHSEWFQNGVVVMDGDRPRIRPDGQPDLRFVYYPADGAEIVDTWDSLGLRGTGSHDVVVSGLTVPEEHTAAPLLDPARRDEHLFRLPFWVLLSIFMSGFPLGVARRALDEYAALAPNKSRGPNAESLAADPRAQYDYGHVAAGVLAARSLVLDSAADLWATLQRGDPTTPAQHTRAQLAMHNAMQAGIAAVDTTFTLTGAAAVYAGHPLQRCFRDLHTAQQHFAFSGQGFRGYAQHRFTSSSR